MEPFEHQVSGQNNVVCLTKDTLAKPLNKHELKFYQTIDETLIPYIPKYKGTIRTQRNQMEAKETHKIATNLEKLRGEIKIDF